MTDAASTPIGPLHQVLRRLLPPGVAPDAWRMLAARGLRAVCDGYMAVLLPAYLLALGLGQFEVGLISTATLLGSAAATLWVGAWGHRVAPRALLCGAALLMAGTGLGFAGLSSFWPLLVVAFVGTLNPSSGDVSVFLPLEHARIADAAQGEARTALFARYSVLGALCAAVGALAAAVPDIAHRIAGIDRLDAMRALFVVYALTGLAIFRLYRGLPAPAHGSVHAPPAPLGPSRAIVVRLAVLFSVDSFAGGLVVNALLSLWLLQRFGITLSQAGVFFFWAGLLSAASQFAAPQVAARFGLLNTMVFTHIPANICLVLAALAPARAAGWVRAQMDVPTRTAYVMGVVTPAERTAAASFTAVPRSLASAMSPALGGALFAAGWISAPMVLCGALKIAYDLTLWRAFHMHPPRED